MSRESARKQCVVYLNVTGPDGAKLGRVENLSAQGVLLRHECALRPGDVRELRIALPVAMGGTTIGLIGVVRWCGEPDDGIRRSGLSLADVTPSKLMVIDELARRFSFEGTSIMEQGE